MRIIGASTGKLLGCAAALAMSGALFTAGAPAVLASADAAAAQYNEYYIDDWDGYVVYDILGAHDGVTVWAEDAILYPPPPRPIFEFRNGSTDNGVDVYELYDPHTNKCIDWLGAKYDLFGEAGCKRGAADEDFSYGNINNGNFTELDNVGASDHYKIDGGMCFSSLGEDTGSGGWEVKAYKCTDNSFNQLWSRIYVGKS